MLYSSVAPESSSLSFPSIAMRYAMIGDISFASQNLLCSLIAAHENPEFTPSVLKEIIKKIETNGLVDTPLHRAVNEEGKEIFFLLPSEVLLHYVSLFEIAQKLWIWMLWSH